MATPTVLVATWHDGLIAITDGNFVHEMKPQPVRGLLERLHANAGASRSEGTR